MIVGAVQAYQLAIAHFSQMRTLDVWYARLDADMLIRHAPDEDTRRHWENMATRAFNRLPVSIQLHLTQVTGSRRIIGIDNNP